MTVTARKRVHARPHNGTCICICSHHWILAIWVQGPEKLWNCKGTNRSLDFTHSLRHKKYELKHHTPLSLPISSVRRWGAASIGALSHAYWRNARHRSTHQAIKPRSTSRCAVPFFIHLPQLIKSWRWVISWVTVGLHARGSVSQWQSALLASGQLSYSTATSCMDVDQRSSRTGASCASICVELKALSWSCSCQQGGAFGQLQGCKL